ncbi:hydrolethalus syndrome protein 1 homolog [Acanthopagrus latus]|uniref:hydrolethalus syndrome protein 1 homolog n=1 Tax=Acanthopagrus latus TaxID=8177 RepID=UPI00187BCD56|nr:hydrolethalus syndrome protein 1 homolog [Acanthopagrus latus]
MDNLDFTEEEIQRQLAVMGYRNIPVRKVHQVKQDLDELIQRGRGRSFSSPPQTNAAESQTATSRPSPPAFTKEKVGHRYFEDAREGFYLHAGPWDYDRELPTTSQIRDFGQQQRNFDPYTQNLVDPGALSRLQVEPDQDDTVDPTLSDSYTSSADSQGRRFIKRIVLRKRKGKTLICDESFYSEDSDAASSLEERLADLNLSPSSQHDFEAESEDVTSQSDTQSSESDRVPMSAFESYIRGMTRPPRDGDIKPKHKAFIRPVMNQQPRKKTDPVAKYFQYKQLWDMFKLPGEQDRRAVRLEIKERLAYQPPPPKPRRVYLPNTYIVPTDKRRSALRWEIRNNLAHGLVPYKYSHRF